MILVDTSVWVHHLRAGNARLMRQLEAGAVLMHPFVLGEIALGKLRRRSQILADLGELPGAQVAEPGEVARFIEQFSLDGRGIGYVDVHLLAAVRLTPGSGLWTCDRRLHDVAFALGLAATAASEG